jgi:hypothetical protein
MQMSWSSSSCSDGIRIPNIPLQVGHWQPGSSWLAEVVAVAVTAAAMQQGSCSDEKFTATNSQLHWVCMLGVLSRAQVHALRSALSCRATCMQ